MAHVLGDTDTDTDTGTDEDGDSATPPTAVTGRASFAWQDLLSESSAMALKSIGFGGGKDRALHGEGAGADTDTEAEAEAADVEDGTDLEL